MTELSIAFNWDISFNFAHNQSKVLKLGEGIDKLKVGEPRTRWAYIYHALGQPYSTIWGFTQNSIGDQKMYYDDGGPDHI